MVSVSAKIAPTGGTIFGISGENYVYNNNISSFYTNLCLRQFEGAYPFLLGVDKFSDKKTYVDDRLDYFIGNIIADDKGEFADPYYFFISRSAAAQCIFIFFDTANNEYPPEIAVNDVTYHLSSPIFVLDAGTESSYVSITISKWNKPNRPLVMQGITLTWSILSHSIKSVSYSGQDRSDPLLPSWGIKSNQGTLEFVDIYNVTTQLRDSNFLPKSLIDIYLKVNKREEKIASFYISNAERNVSTDSARLNFVDMLMEWNSTPTPSVLGSNRKQSIWEFANTDIRNFALEPTDIETEEHLQNIIIDAPYLEEGSLWATVVKLCELSQCYVYCDNSKIAKIRYGRGT